MTDIAISDLKDYRYFSAVALNLLLSVLYDGIGPFWEAIVRFSGEEFYLFLC